MEKCILQVAEYSFIEIVKYVGSSMNRTLEGIPIISTIKHVMQPRKVSVCKHRKINKKKHCTVSDIVNYLVWLICI